MPHASHGSSESSKGSDESERPRQGHQGTFVERTPFLRLRSGNDKTNAEQSEPQPESDVVIRWAETRCATGSYLGLMLMYGNAVIKLPAG